MLFPELMNVCLSYRFRGRRGGHVLWTAHKSSAPLFRFCLGHNATRQLGATVNTYHHVSILHRLLMSKISGVL